ncbi:hypothetical protein L3C95_01085 [Chitinophaga filiformis]|uniref:hypothetical protein n=1 Tax=Chitinophaga filiformis TaxID=104663 RepID=UPI001F3200FA|nr:hypothetical protein [Chitinophaga filiformis]MCF6401445.1 hypothetical protein [Chitinophaga filiformis]
MKRRAQVALNKLTLSARSKRESKRFAQAFAKPMALIFNTYNRQLLKNNHKWHNYNYEERPFC